MDSPPPDTLGRLMQEAGPPAALDLERYLPFLIVATGNRLSSGASNYYLKHFGIGVTAWRVLANLKAQPGMTANAIAGFSDLDKGAVSRTVAALIASGDVGQGAAEADRRKRPLALTPKGTALHDRVLAVALARETQLMAGLTAEDREVLLRALAVVHANAQNME